MFRFLFLSFAFTQLVACIGTDLVEDFVEPELRINAAPDTIGFGESFQFTATYLNNVGQVEEFETTWSSTDPTVIEIDTEGLALARAAGSTIITSSVEVDGVTVEDEIEVAVGAETVIVVNETRSGDISTTSSYRLTGGFEVSEISGGIRIDVMEDYQASTALPGLFIYLTNNPSTTSGALEIGPVQVFNGAHFYEVDGATIDQYSHLLYFCKPFNVKVGDGEFKAQ
ncbi:MAG: hypothetical protein AB8F78_04175 [Saprospiraceae bacterium]